MDYSFSIIFNNKPGFVIRVALILERRGFEIKSLIIKDQASGTFSEMILKCFGSESKSEQVRKQLFKLIDVISVEEVVLQENFEVMYELNHAS